MSAESKPVTPDPRWLIHDLIVGILAGAGGGSLVGALMSVRWLDNNLLILAGAVAGAVVGVSTLLASHRRHNRFWTTSAVVSWFLLVASGSVIAALATAIANFN